MQVTLKKAAELSRAAIAASKAVEIKSVVSASAFSTDTLDLIVDEGRTAFNDALDRALGLATVGFNIRAAIGTANATAGVDMLLTKVALIDEQIARINAASGSTDMFGVGDSIDTNDMSAATRKVEQLRKDVVDAESRRSPYANRDELTINLLAAEQKLALTDMVAALKRQRSALKDELTGINFNTKITLSDDAVQALRDEKLID